MRPIITSVRVRSGGRHDTVTVWNRGGCAGTLTVEFGDGVSVADRLLPAADDTEEGDVSAPHAGEVYWERRVQ